MTNNIKFGSREWIKERIAFYKEATEWSYQDYQRDVMTPQEEQTYNEMKRNYTLFLMYSNLDSPLYKSGKTTYTLTETQKHKVANIVNSVYYDILDSIPSPESDPEKITQYNDYLKSISL